MENITEEIKERDKKLFESQKELMELLEKEAVEHGKDGTAKLLKKVNETEGQKILSERSITIVETLRNNRFIVSFPKEFGIDEWCVKSITMPIISNKKCSDTIIVFNKFIEPLTSKLVLPLMNKKRFCITVKFLDSTLNPIEIWNINIKNVLSIDLGGVLNYSDDSIFEMKVIFKTKNCILKD